MTLVLAVLTQDAVFLAADRRMVWLRDDGSTRVKDDDQNKMVFFASRMMLGYTGFAELGPKKQRTDEWLAEAIVTSLGNEDQADILNSVAGLATKRLQHPIYRRLPRRLRGHEFVACGWGRNPPGADFRPYVAWVSNLRTEKGGLLPLPGDRFAMGFSMLPEDGVWGCFAAGQPLPKETDDLFRELVAESQGNFERIGEALINSIRWAAASNDAIGRGVLLTVLPKEAVENDTDTSTILFGPPMKETASCFHLPADANQLVAHSPIIVSASGQILRAFGGPAGSTGVPSAHDVLDSSE